MGSDERYRISFLRHQSVDRTFRDLLNDEFVRKNVDPFFLYTSNYLLLSQFISEKKAIAYALNEASSCKCSGVFLAFRSGDCLYGHFLFRKHRRTNIILTIDEMILRTRKYFKRNGIRISKIIGQIPEKNRAAIWVARKLGARYEKKYYADPGGDRIVEYVLTF